MNAIVTVDTPAVPTEAGTVLQVIERASRDAAVDIDKLERLLAMHERIVARQAQAAYADALARMQPELPLIVERGTIKMRDGTAQSRYALWEDVVSIITPVLSKYGFSLSFRTGNEGDRVTVTGVLTHALGHSEQTSLTLPIDTSGSKNAVQSVGSSTSYGKRYTASALLNLRTGEVDDDGASAPPTDNHDPRGDALAKADPAAVEAMVAKMLAAINLDADEDARALAVMDVHDAVKFDNDNYIAAREAAAARMPRFKSAWKAYVTRGKELDQGMAANGRAA